MNNISRLMGYIKPYKKRFVYAMVCMIFVALFQSMLMLLIKPAIDKIFAAHQSKYILPIVAGIVGSGLLKFFFSYMQNYLLSWIGQSIVRDIRNEMYGRMMTLSLDYFIKSSTGKLISGLTYDVSLLQRGVVMIPRNILRDGLYVIFYIGILFYLNWKWTLAIFIAFPLISSVIIVIGRKIKRRSAKAQSLTAAIYSILQEKITGIKLIKSVTYEQKEIEHMESQNKRYFDIFMKLTKADILQAPLIEFLGVIGMGVVVMWGGVEVIKGTATQGTFIAFLATAMSMYRPAKSLTDVNTDIQTALAATDKIFEMLDRKPTVVEKPEAVELTEFKNEIIFDDVSFYYDCEKPVLSGINFGIRRGGVVALVGHSGSGKTTIANLIARFYDVTGGRITIDGTDIRDFSFRSLRAKMGIVTQETILFNDSVLHNISYGMENKTAEEVQNAAKLANAHDFITRLPQGYDTVVGEKGVMLSGGERQRLAIARVILRDPHILLLDEATSSLDSSSEMLVQEAITKLMGGRTTVAIAHRLSTIKSADKIIVLDNGRISASGTHGELLEKSSLYKRLYEIQYSK